MFWGHSLVGALKAAKLRNVVTFDGAEPAATAAITLLREDVEDADADTCASPPPTRAHLSCRLVLSVVTNKRRPATPQTPLASSGSAQGARRPPTRRNTSSARVCRPRRELTPPCPAVCRHSPRGAHSRPHHRPPTPLSPPTPAQQPGQNRSGSFARHVLGGVASAGQSLAGSLPTLPSADENEEDEAEAIEDVLAALSLTLDDDLDDGDSGAAAPPSDARAAAYAAQAKAVADVDPFAKVFDLPDSNSAVQAKLGSSVRRGDLNPRRALQASRFVDREIRRLIELIQKHGEKPASGGGLAVITFGRLVRSSAGAFLSSQLAGLLRTARSRSVVAFDADVLLRGASDSVVIRLLRSSLEDADVETYTFEQVRSASMRRMSRGRRGSVRPQRRPTGPRRAAAAAAPAASDDDALAASLAALSAADSDLRALGGQPASDVDKKELEVRGGEGVRGGLAKRFLPLGQHRALFHKTGLADRAGVHQRHARRDGVFVGVDRSRPRGETPPTPRATFRAPLARLTQRFALALRLGLRRSLSRYRMTSAPSGGLGRM